MMNVASVIVAGVLAPLWWPVWRLTRLRWIAWERRRTQRVAAGGTAMRMPIRRWTLWGIFAFGLPAGLMTAVATAWTSNVPIPWWVSATQVLLLMLLGVAFGVVMKWFLTRRHRFERGHCRSCGYDLKGLPSEVCPECGYHFAAEDATAD